MGQYYKAVVLNYNNDVVASFDPYNFDKGCKLMEHSYLHNYFMNVVANYFATEYLGYRLVWAGDYADPEVKNEFNLYELSKNYQTITQSVGNENYRYLVNLCTNQYVDLEKVVQDSDGWPIHPLSLLTCEGNGRGGGDFRGNDPNNLVGSWARNTIKFTNEFPEFSTELIFDSIE